ncbi:MAG: hypothetical protein AB7Q00_08700 [Phycisphaerales bacterium]
MTPIQFFATKQDLLSVLELIDRNNSVHYMRAGNELTPHFDSYKRGADIPNLGVANRETGAACTSYLVAYQTTPFSIRTIVGPNGTQRYLVDQLMNPDSVSFTPAGMWEDNTLLQGVIGTASASETSYILMKQFRSAITTSFKKLQRRFVGPHSLMLLHAGKRLTIAVQSPPEFDLADVAAN